MPMTMTVGLQNPVGTINRSGRSSGGATSETELISAVSVPSGDEHHLTDFVYGVAKGAAGTIFRIYARASSSDSWTQVGDIECGDYGTYTRSFGTSLKIPAGHQWRVTVQQSTAARCSIGVNGVAKVTDVRDYS